MYAPGFDFVFLHGTSQSGGILIAGQRACIQQMVLHADIPGYALAVDVTVKSQVLRVINFYRHLRASIRSLHLLKLFSWVHGNRLMLMGDFNSVTSVADRRSGNLDPTSILL